MTAWVFVFPPLIAACSVLAGVTASYWVKGQKR